MRNRTRVRAFTLVELLVVIGIIALLVSILLPTMAKARAGANNIRCLSNLRVITHGVMQYVTDNRGALPYIYTGSSTTVDVPAEYGRSYWPMTIGGIDNKADLVAGWRPKYVPYYQAQYSGGVWNCPFATTQIQGWMTVNRFSFHYSMNQYIMGVRKTGLSWSTPCKKISVLRPSLVLAGDGAIFYNTYMALNNYYFTDGLGYLLAGGVGMVDDSSKPNNAPWPIDKPGTKIRWHNQCVNLSYLDGSASSITGNWSETAMKPLFVP